MDETKPMGASEFVEDPDLVYSLINEYVLIRDMSVRSTYVNLIEAINLFSERGWDTVSLTMDNGGFMYALLRNMAYKHKNRPDAQ